MTTEKKSNKVKNKSDVQAKKPKVAKVSANVSVPQKPQKQKTNNINAEVKHKPAKKTNENQVKVVFDADEKPMSLWEMIKAIFRVD